MLIEEEDATELKQWIVKRLEDISDADSDVLADYVLALIRADTPDAQLRLDAIGSLEDFLKYNTTAFVDEVFRVVQSKAHVPGSVPPPTLSSTPSLPPSTLQIPEPIRANVPFNTSQGSHPSFQASRKRSFGDRQGSSNGIDPHYAQGGRQIKQLRRGGRGGRGNGFGFGGRGGAFPDPAFPQSGPLIPLDFSNMPLPQGMPFDANDPIGAMMVMQSLGLPSLPGLPPMLQAGSPNGQSQFGIPGSPVANGKSSGGKRGRCRDYDNKGYCTRGDVCRYLHAADRIVVPGQDEYDPRNAAIMDTSPTSPLSNGHGSANSQPGNGNTRGAGRGRGDQGGTAPRRNNRAEFSHAGPNHDRSITTIVVEQIPEDRFDEQAVRDFFSEFGTIEEVTMQPYKRLALVKYQEYAAAREAYDSPRVIFDNRFVKIYWYKPGSLQKPQDSGKPSLTSPTASKSEEIPFDREKFEKDAQAAQKKMEEKRAQMKEMEIKRQELEKQKEQLAQKQAAEKRKLLEKIAAKGGDSNTNTEVADVTTNGTDDGKVSEHTKILRAKVAELEAEAKSLGLDSALSDSYSPRGRGRGRERGSYRGWEGFAGRGSYKPYRGIPRGGRGSFQARSGGQHKLDNRTKKVGVSGVEFTSEKDEALRQYLLGVGEFEAIETHPNRTDMQIITFKDRPTAESFMYSTKDIPSVGKLEFNWCMTPLPAVQSAAKPAGIGDEDIGMGNMNTDGDNPDKGSVAEVDYDVAEEDDRWE